MNLLLSYTYRTWLVGQAVKTPPSHGGNRGSIPLRTVLFIIKQPNPKMLETCQRFVAFFLLGKVVACDP